jgi:hypothetical protein
MSRRKGNQRVETDKFKRIGLCQDRPEPAISSGGGKKYSFPVKIVEHPEMADKFTNSDEKEIVDSEMKYVIALNETFVNNGGVIDKDNNPGRKWCLDTNDQLKSWFKSFSSDLGIKPAYHPDIEFIPGTDIRMSSYFRRWFRNIDVAIGLRERAAWEESTLKNAIYRSATLSASGICRPAVGVFASGDGEVALRAVKQVVNDRIMPRVFLLDKNPVSLFRAEREVKNSGLQNVTVVLADLLNIDGIKMTGIVSGGEIILAPDLPDSVLPDKFDIIDVVGLFPYMRKDDWMMESEISSFNHKESDIGIKRVGAVSLLKNFNQRVNHSHDGIILFDSINLVDPHNVGNGPLAHLTFLDRDMGWKGLAPTTENGDLGLLGEKGILPMIQEAQIAPAKVTVDRMPHGIFNGYVIEFDHCGRLFDKGKDAKVKVVDK